MINSLRRRVLKTGFITLMSSGATITSALLSSTTVQSQVKDAAKLTPEQWMDEWIERWKKEAKDVEGMLYLGRFADPFYFLTKEIGWRPNPGQSEALRPVIVPVGFVTDFASIPQAFWSLLRPDGEYAYAAVIHDYLYWTQRVSRQDADQTLKLAMKDFGIDNITVNSIYTAVRAGGWKAWESNEKLKESGEKRILSRFPTDPKTRWEEFRNLPDVFVE